MAVPVVTPVPGVPVVSVVTAVPGVRAVLTVVRPGCGV